MTTNFNHPGSYQIKEGETVFLEGSQVNALIILLQGIMDVYISSDSTTNNGGDVLSKCYKICTLEKGIFIGANDILSSRKYSCSYRALEDCTLYVYPYQSLDQIWSLVSEQKDYGSFIINSIYTMASNLCAQNRKVFEVIERLRIITENLISFFWVMKEYSEFSYTPTEAFFSEGLERLESLRESGLHLLPAFNKELIETDKSETQNEENIYEDSAIKQKIKYYEHLNNMPIELRKTFFGTDLFVTEYHCRDEAGCFEALLSKLRGAFAKAEEYFKLLYSDNTESIYYAYLKAASEMSASGQDTSAIVEALDYIVSVINEIVNLYKVEYCHKCETDLEYLEHAYVVSKASIENKTDSSASSSTAGKVVVDYQSLPEELKDSAAKILEYSGLPKEQTDAFMIKLLSFRSLRDRLSTVDNARVIRSNLSGGFFEIYEAVFKKASLCKDNSRLINMFLNYGYMDERMLTPEQTLTLYKLAGKDTAKIKGLTNTMRDWLTKVYSLEKDPSINEFGQDYLDIFRDMKRRGQVTDKDKIVYESNGPARLSFEIDNMLKTNQKICHGQISTYSPVLHQQMITRDLDKSYVTPERVRESLDKILEIDFSAFYREIHFIDNKRGIEKETIMKSFEPDIVLVPIYGSRAVMWQELTGKNRSTPGRFLIPAFTDEDLDSMILRLVGNFRWELCRTMMGAYWNDITQPSITSEYTDYIQFFKKNKDLPDEAKEKLKAQSIRFHGRSRDIFTSDYETWINYESKGNVRLNKVVRSIMYKYCPFNKSIRDQLEKQPMFADMAILFRNQRNKAAKDLGNRYSRYIKANGSLDPDMEHNLIFFRDM